MCADILSSSARSALMGRIRGKHTKPELTVRRVLHRLGHRFRLHVGSLPGRPDIVLSKRKKIIQVHGCFWHRHTCRFTYSQKSRTAFWERKFADNVRRDAVHLRKLRELGWSVLIVWECQTVSEGKLVRRLSKFIGPKQAT